MKAMAISSIVGAVVLAFGSSFILSFPLFLAWNYVMPYLFGFKTISWLQAWCLTWIASALIKSSLNK